MKIDIAVAVLRRAADYDHRVEVSDRKALAWTRLFEGQRIWMTEALAAVDAHYRKPNPFAIMPGDILAFCENCPPHSSREHANDFLTSWSQHPYADMIEVHSGIQAPAIDIPDSLPRTEHRAFLIGHLTAWVNENRERLVDAILAKRHGAVNQ